MERRTDITARMSCGHELRFPVTGAPRIREIIWCFSCARYREVVKAPGEPKEYRGTCRNCRKGFRAVCLPDVFKPVVKHVNARGHSVSILDNDGKTLLVVIDSQNVTGYLQESLFQLDKLDACL